MKTKFNWLVDHIDSIRMCYGQELSHSVKCLCEPTFSQDSISCTCTCVIVHKKYMYLNLVDDIICTIYRYCMPFQESWIQTYGICTL